MKYTIHGFNQEKLIEYELDSIDALILRYFIDFKDSGSMVSEAIEGETYYWLKYEGILKELPVLKIKKDSIYRRLKKMCEAGVLKHRTMKRYGTYSFYSLGKNYVNLISDSNPRESEINPEGVRNKIRRGTDLNPDQKIHLLKDPSIKNNTSSCSRKNVDEKQVVLFHLEKCGFGLISPNLVEKIAADIEIYGPEWVKDAITIADENGKHRYDYVKAILENWKRDGKGAKHGGIRKNTGQSAADLCDFSNFGGTGG